MHWRRGAVVVEASYVKSLSVLLIPVLWLLMVGCRLRISRASMIESLWLLNSLNRIFVLLTRSSLVRIMLWLSWACYFGPPEARCMVSLRERVVVVSPM